MLFMLAYTSRSGHPYREAIERFVQWAPPAGLELKANWWNANANGGFALAEAASVGPIMEAVSNYADVLDFEVHPVLATEDALPVLQKSYGWIDSVS